MTQLRPPLILIASVRSGTTFTASCFMRHDGIKIWREKRMIWTIGNVTHPNDRFTAEMATPSVVRKIRKRWLDFQEANGNRVIMEKTPSNCLRVPYVRRIFPEARIIHMVRDGRDAVSSALPFWTRPRRKKRMLRRMRETSVLQWPLYLPWFVTDQVLVRMGIRKRTRSWGPVYPGLFDDLKVLDLVEVVAKQWVAAVETASADLADMDSSQVIHVRYEDLVARPHEYFAKFLTMVGLEMNERLSEYLTTQVRTSAVGAWKSRLSPQQVERMMPILEPALRRLGYPIEVHAPLTGARKTDSA